MSHDQITADAKAAILDADFSLSRCVLGLVLLLLIAWLWLGERKGE